MTNQQDDEPERTGNDEPGNDKPELNDADELNETDDHGVGAPGDPSPAVDRALVEEVSKALQHPLPPDLHQQLSKAFQPISLDFSRRIREIIQPITDDFNRQIRESIKPLVPDYSQIIKPLLPDYSQIVRPLVPEFATAIQDLVKIELPKLEFPKFDFPQIAELTAGIRAMATKLLEKLPPNWPRDGDLIELVFPIVQDEGIPLVWVPRSDIVTDLVEASNRADRIKILIARCDDITRDCREVLADVTHPDMANQIPLATDAISALAHGHGSAAQALATVVTETVVKRTFQKRYDEVRRLVKIDDPRELTVGELGIRTALAAIGPFYAPWWPNTGDPMPVELSRHVTVHLAETSHYDQGNNIIAVMLMASVLRAVQELNELP